MDRQKSRKVRVWACMYVMIGLLIIPTQSWAKSVADFLGAEGAPASIAAKLSKGLRSKLRSQKSYKLLAPNSMNIQMARLTLGCVGDSQGCMAKLGSMRAARWLFHVRVFPAGSRAKALFRKIDAKSGKTVKQVSLIFKKTATGRAITKLSNKMFGAPPAPRRAVVVARRTPPPRRVVARRTPPPRRVVVARRTPPPRRVVVARTTPPVRRVVERRTPPVRRVVVARRTPPVRRAVERRMPPRRTVVARTTPVRRVTPRRPTPRRVAMTRRTTPKKRTPTVALWKQPTFWGWIAVAAAVASAGGVLAFGLDSQNARNQAETEINKSRQGAPTSYNTKIKPLVDSGRTSAVMANVFIVVAIAATAGAVFLFLQPKPKAKPTSTLSTQTPSPKPPITPTLTTLHHQTL